MSPRPLISFTCSLPLRAFASPDRSLSPLSSTLWRKAGSAQHINNLSKCAAGAASSIPEPTSLCMQGRRQLNPVHAPHFQGPHFYVLVPGQGHGSKQLAHRKWVKNARRTARMAAELLRLGIQLQTAQGGVYADIPEMMSITVSAALVTRGLPAKVEP